MLFLPPKPLCTQERSFHPLGVSSHTPLCSSDPCQLEWGLGTPQHGVNKPGQALSCASPEKSNTEDPFLSQDLSCTLGCRYRSCCLPRSQTQKRIRTAREEYGTTISTKAKQLGGGCLAKMHRKQGGRGHPVMAVTPGHGCSGCQ